MWFLESPGLGCFSGSASLWGMYQAELGMKESSLVEFIYGYSGSYRANIALNRLCKGV